MHFPTIGFHNLLVAISRAPALINLAIVQFDKYLSRPSLATRQSDCRLPFCSDDVSHLKTSCDGVVFSPSVFDYLVSRTVPSKSVSLLPACESIGLTRGPLHFFTDLNKTDSFI